jgi:hypothetical protein
MQVRSFLQDEEERVLIEREDYEIGFQNSIMQFQRYYNLRNQKVPPNPPKGNPPRGNPTKEAQNNIPSSSHPKKDYISKDSVAKDSIAKDSAAKDIVAKGEAERRTSEEIID